jgi:hypothetical protein
MGESGIAKGPAPRGASLTGSGAAYTVAAYLA